MWEFIKKKKERWEPPTWCGLTNPESNCPQKPIPPTSNPCATGSSKDHLHNHQTGSAWSIQPSKKKGWKQMENGLLYLLCIFWVPLTLFQHFISDMPLDLLDQFVIACLANILIFSKDPEQHLSHVCILLGWLHQDGFFVKLEMFIQPDFHQIPLLYPNPRRSKNGPMGEV